MPRYMLDTNVFNHVLEGKIDAATLKGKELVATHVQRDELLKTKDDDRRRALLAVFSDLTPEHAATSTMVAGISVAGGAAASRGGVVPTESAAWGVSRFGQAKWGHQDDIFAGMRGELDAFNKRKGNNTHDILIAETALRNGWVLVTSDADLFAVVTKYGGACANLFALAAA
jgi:predicted nucleic acid-binding protein